MGLPCTMYLTCISLFVGFGVFATQSFSKGSFLLEYTGHRLSSKRAEEKEERRKGKHRYVFYNKWNGNHA